MNRREFVQSGSAATSAMLLLKPRTAFSYDANSAVHDIHKINDVLQSGNAALELFKSEDDPAGIVHLKWYNPGEQVATTELHWNGTVGAASYSNTAEEALTVLTGPVTLAGQDVVTLRIEK